MTRFDRHLRLMRSRNPQVAEDTFGALQAMAGDHLQDLIEAFRTEGDHGVRCWLLELIGDVRSDAALPLLVEQLNGEDESLRDWAARGLRNLNTRPAREALWRARCNGVPVD